MHRAFTALLVALQLAAGCSSASSDNGGPSDERQLILVEPLVPDVGLKPGHSQVLRVRYRGGSGAALPGREVTFSIAGDSRGSTLSADTAITDGEGIAAVELHAGSAETSFSVQISAENAPQELLYIEVGYVGFGVIHASTSYEGSFPSTTVVTVDYLLYGEMGCSERPPHDPPAADRTVADATPSEPVRFGSLRVDQERSLLALGYDAGKRLRAAGCTDVPANVLRQGSTIALQVALSDLPPRIMGSYDLTTDLQLDADAQPLSDALAPWNDLSDCALDPAQLLLDCVIDAADDSGPPDCQVDSISAIAAELEAYRGVIDPSTGCRGSLTATSQPSLDEVLASTMTANDATGSITALREVPAEARELLTNLRLDTQLVLSEPSSLQRDAPLSASHRVQQIAFVKPDGSLIAFEANRTALAVPLATSIPAVLSGWQLSIDRHRLGIRFALLARVALGDGVLTPLQLPRESANLAEQLVGLIAATDVASGCPALSKIVCGSAGRAADCLLVACDAGVAALADYLDGGFAALDSLAADLSLAGTARIIDDSGDLLPDKLAGDDSQPATWTEARLLLGDELREVPAKRATFTGRPTPE